MTYKHHHSLFTGIRRHHSAPSADNLAKWVGSSPQVPIRCFTVQDDGSEHGQPKGGGRRRQMDMRIDARDEDDDGDDSNDDRDSSEIREWEVTDENLSDFLDHNSPSRNEPFPAIRIVICHEAEGKYYMGLDSFKLVDKRFDLPVQALSVLSAMWGTQASQFEFKGRRQKKGRTLDIVVRTPSIEQFSQCGIALTYDLDRKTTSAFVRGANAVRLDASQNEEPHTVAGRFAKSLKWTRSLWRHPLLLPVILLSQEIRCIMVFARKNLHVNAQDVAEKLSIDSYGKMSELLGGRNKDRGATQKRTEFTARINDLMRNAINARRGLRSAQAMIAFLRDVLTELEEEGMSGEDDKAWRNTEEEVLSSKKIRSYLRSFDQFAKGLEVGIDAIISNLEVQLNLLGIVASQLDNTRGAEMAAQAGLDSVAMITLAVVTAIFLPGTFVASLFSMSMFDWQASTATNVISGNFWIYWAVTVPLTVLVLTGWWVWWCVSRLYYTTKFSVATGVVSKTRLEALAALFGGSSDNKDKTS